MRKGIFKLVFDIVHCVLHAYNSCGTKSSGVDTFSLKNRENIFLFLKMFSYRSLDGWVKTF